MRNYWNLAITFSLVFHGALIMKLPTAAFFNTKKDIVKKQAEKEVTMVSKKIETKAKIKTDYISAIEPKPYQENIMDTLMQSSSFTPIDKVPIFEKNASKIILSEIPPHNKALAKNPAYMNYYRVIREKIRSNTYRYYRSGDTGKVLLNFIVRNDGALGGLFLDQESVDSRILRQITLESIKDAAPFPPFPVELNSHTQLSFRIPIYFKNN